MDPIHPIEITVQQALEQPLQSFNLNITSLYESQLILAKILTRLQATIETAINNVSDPISEGFLSRVELLHQKIEQIETILARVETRLDQLERPR